MEKARQDRMKSLGLVSLNNFGGLWDRGVVLICLIPGPGMTKVEEYCLLGSTGPDGGDMVLHEFYIRSTFQAGSFAISKNWLTLGGAVSPQLECCVFVFVSFLFRMSRCQIHRQFKNIYNAYSFISLMCSDK